MLKRLMKTFAASQAAGGRHRGAPRGRVPHGRHGAGGGSTGARIGAAVEKYVRGRRH